MSDYVYLLERLRQAEAAVSELEAALSREPGDQALELDLVSARRSAREYQKEILAIAPSRLIDVCRYRIVPSVADDLRLSDVTGSLRAFQELFTLVFYALQSGEPRKTAHVPSAILAETGMNFGWTYSGSLGIVLMIDSEKRLFETKFDETVAMLLHIVEIERQEDVKDIAARLGIAPIIKAYEWANRNFTAAYDVDLHWRNAAVIERGRYIQRSDFVRMVDNIGLASDVERDIITIDGILAGGDILTNRFHFVDTADRDYRGIISANFLAERMELGEKYEARILVETVRRYAEEHEERSYTLLSLSPKLHN